MHRVDIMIVDSFLVIFFKTFFKKLCRFKQSHYFCTRFGDVAATKRKGVAVFRKKKKKNARGCCENEKLDISLQPVSLKKKAKPEKSGKNLER